MNLSWHLICRYWSHFSSWQLSIRMTRINLLSIGKAICLYSLTSKCANSISLHGKRSWYAVSSTNNHLTLFHYTDQIMLIGPSEQELATTLNLLKNMCIKGREINVAKILFVSENPRRPMIRGIQRYFFLDVRQVVELGPWQHWQRCAALTIYRDCGLLTSHAPIIHCLCPSTWEEKLEVKEENLHDRSGKGPSNQYSKGKLLSQSQYILQNKKLMLLI